jgi:DNA topoisomerase-1
MTQMLALPPDDPSGAAAAAGLRYLGDDRPGLRRRRAGRGYAYYESDGRLVRDQPTLARIKKLAIPSAWREVWISPSSRGHLQATGRDARGRKQYRYHDRWRAVRDEAKYDRLLAFGQALPLLRAQVDADLRQPTLSRTRILAAIVRLLDTTLIRIGNDEYARQNRSFGLTTLQTRHVRLEGERLLLRFSGKSGREHRITLHDPRLARVVRRCQELPGQTLFQYRDEGGACWPIDSDDVNGYLRAVTEQSFSAKDFRTWAGTVIAARALAEAPPAESDSQATRSIAQAVAQTAERLGNTPAVCRRCYIHPAVLDAYQDASLRRFYPATGPGQPSAADGLAADEVALLELLGSKSAAESSHSGAA